MTNLASRLNALARPGQILVGPADSQSAEQPLRDWDTWLQRLRKPARADCRLLPAPVHRVPRSHAATLHSARGKETDTDKACRQTKQQTKSTVEPC